MNTLRWCIHGLDMWAAQPSIGPNAVLTAFFDTPKRMYNAFRDPVRRRHVVARVVEGYVGGLSVLAALLVYWVAIDWLSWDQVWWLGRHRLIWWTLLPLAAPLGEFLIFEWIIEPLGWSSYYWERGPRDNETFTRP